MNEMPVILTTAELPVTATRDEIYAGWLKARERLLREILMTLVPGVYYLFVLSARETRSPMSIIYPDAGGQIDLHLSARFRAVEINPPEQSLGSVAPKSYRYRQRDRVADALVRIAIAIRRGR